MTQTPVPPLPPGLDPNLVFNEVVPIVAAVVVILVLAVALRGSSGHRWARRSPSASERGPNGAGA